MMLDHIKKFAGLGLIMASTIFPIMFSTNDARANLDWDEMAENFMRCQEIPTNLYNVSDESLVKLNNRIRDMVIDMIRLEYI